MAETLGYLSTNLTPEDVLEHLPEVLSETDYTYPIDAAELSGADGLAVTDFAHREYNHYPLAIQALPHVITGGMIADVVAVIGSTDVVMGDCDR